MREDDDRTLLEHLYRRSGDPADGLLPGPLIARNVITTVVFGVVALQVVVWIAVSAGTGQVVFPWWLWTLAGGVVVLSALWMLTSRTSHAPATDTARPTDTAPVTDTAPAASHSPHAGASRQWQFSWHWLYWLLLTLFVVSSVAQFVVWLVLGLVDGEFDTAWWSWSVLPFAVVVAAVWVMSKDEQQRNARGARRE